jgi:peptidoglycan/LPS O-acetylase OafA/YrhL
MRESKSVAYRPDIDGLRAIAIVSVVAYHAVPELVRGGFVGVDIFFVISGFLISSIIFHETDGSRFSLLRFYARRVKRLFPALILVLVVTAVAGWYYLLPHEFRALGAQLAAGAAYVINFILEKQAGYFDVAATEKPLLHLWSLAIEEQFYIVYPALLLLIQPRSCRWTFAVLAATTIISATFSILEVPQNEAAAFYLPQYRIWELSAGGLLALGENYARQFLDSRRWVALPTRPLDVLRGLFSLTGLALVLGSAFAFNGAIVYPGAWALIPCLGALLLIAAGSANPVNRWLLSNRLLVGIGLISYPLYLWHWPLLSFAHTLGVAGDWRVRLGAVTAAVVLAIATYVFIERPILRVEGKSIAIVLFAAMWALCIVGGCIIDGFVKPRLDDWRFQDLGDAIADFQFPHGLRKQREPSGRLIEFAGQGGETTMYFGDSNIEQYWPRVERLLGETNGDRSVIFATGGGCPPIPGVPAAHLPRCNGFAESAVVLADRLGVSTVVIGALWSDYFNHSDVSGGSAGTQRAFDNLLRMIQTMRGHGMAVWIILSIPTGEELSPLAGLRRSWTGTADLIPRALDRKAFELSWSPIRSKLVEIARMTGSSVIDPMDWLCNASDCPSRTPQGFFIYKDRGHLRSSYVRDHALFVDETLPHGSGSAIKIYRVSICAKHWDTAKSGARHRQDVEEMLASTSRGKSMPSRASN